MTREFVGYIGMRTDEPEWRRVNGADPVSDGYKHWQIVIYNERDAAIRNETSATDDTDARAVKVRVILESE